MTASDADVIVVGARLAGVACAVDAIDRALPAHTVPSQPRRSVSLGDGIYVCGDHRDTASIQGALFSGRRIAARVIADVGDDVDVESSPRW